MTQSSTAMCLPQGPPWSATCVELPHTATKCINAAPLPRSFAPSTCSPAVFSRPGPAAPPHPITPQPTPSVPASAPSSAHGPVPQGIDKRGRPVPFQGGRIVYNSFNNLGCNVSSCSFLHTCSLCSSTHARMSCPHNITKHGF